MALQYAKDPPGYASSILAQRTGQLSPLLLRLLEDLVNDWRQLDARIGDVTTQIETLAKQDEDCKRLMGTPGVGPLIASAMVAAIGNGAAFIKGRDFAAWLGLVSKQISTSDRTILGSISRRGNRYLRTLFVQDARSVLFRPMGEIWLRSLAYGCRAATTQKCVGHSPRQQARRDRLRGTSSRQLVRT